uniref:Uncharacterized protein n=1 Tax=viral metagenome TaxID=1070528 RepID=A0A6C0ARP4_9ZZZZ
MRILGLFLSFFAITKSQYFFEFNNDDIPSNQCIQFTVTSGTGCDWMCNYCASQLGTNNYYFTDGVCSYQEGQGCVGNPIAGKQYTCCSTTF